LHIGDMPAAVPREYPATAPRVSPGARRGFLILLSEGVPVRDAVGKRSRSTFYAIRRRDPEFAQAWDDAVARAKLLPPD
jgi:hypothetical protein